MKIVDCEQLSEEWFSFSTGRPSASCFDRIVTTKGEPSKQAEKYLADLLEERTTGVKTETYQTNAMARGIELEAEARNLFEMVHDVEVKQVGLVLSDCERYSCSPDGMIGNSGLEIKCPSFYTHCVNIGIFHKKPDLFEKKLPTDHIQQVQGSMLVTGFESWYFMSYYPGLPPLILKVERDDVFCGKLKDALDKFCNDLDSVTNKIRGMQCDTTTRLSFVTGN